MELHLPPEIPMTRVINGHNSFCKGYRHGIRGKTYEEYYGEEAGRAKRLKQSKSLKGKRCTAPPGAASKQCVAVLPDGKFYVFKSIIDASQKLRLNYATLRRYIKKKIKPKNGWKWFLEKDTEWLNLINQ